jgi:hypothetical protein
MKNVNTEGSAMSMNGSEITDLVQKEVEEVLGDLIADVIHRARNLPTSIVLLHVLSGVTRANGNALLLLADTLRHEGHSSGIDEETVRKCSVQIQTLLITAIAEKEIANDGRLIDITEQIDALYELAAKHTHTDDYRHGEEN